MSAPLHHRRTAAAWPADPRIEPLQRRNLLVLALHQIVFRIGWVFKTESVVIPAFLDSISGAGWLRGCLPVLTRFGQSLPPVFYAERLKRARRKSATLSAVATLLAVPFGLLALAWAAGGGLPPDWMPVVFLAAYFLFFVGYGLYQMAFGTVQGKLVRPTRRGRLLWLSTIGGMPPAMLLAWWLLDDWLRRPDGGFGYVFGFVAGWFLLSGVVALGLREPPDAWTATPKHRSGGLAAVSAVLHRDANLRRLVWVSVLFGVGLVLAPHYQALARQRLGLGSEHLMIWVVTQNASVSLLSLVVGPLADRRGYRLTLELLIFASAITPVLAIALSHLGAPGGSLFWLVFVALGVPPLLVTTLMNYALEICRPAEHPLYLGTVNLCLLLPYLLSPLAGWLIDAVGFDGVFAAATVAVLAGGVLAFRLLEPRPHPLDDPAVMEEA